MKMTIDEVQRVAVEELKKHDGVEILERSIIVLDKNGGTYEIVLRAHAQAMLEFHSIESRKEAWFLPKVYKGSKAMRQEEEE
jgi:hypothetical protein